MAWRYVLPLLARRALAARLAQAQSALPARLAAAG
jgi:hypothetical protein